MSGHRTAGHTFVVTTGLGIEQFDRRREGAACVKAVMAEIRRIRRSDRRVRRARLRTLPGRRAGYEVELTIVAPTGWQAFEIGSAVVRASIHTVGGSTAGWERLRPELSIGTIQGRCRPSTPTSWAEVAAAAARAAAAPALPPMGAVAGAPQLAPVPVAGPLVSAGVIDLR